MTVSYGRSSPVCSGALSTSMVTSQTLLSMQSMVKLSVIITALTSFSWKECLARNVSHVLQRSLLSVPDCSQKGMPLCQ